MKEYLVSHEVYNVPIYSKLLDGQIALKIFITKFLSNTLQAIFGKSQQYSPMQPDLSQAHKI
jgi:hypothetical protein